MVKLLETMNAHRKPSGKGNEVQNDKLGAKVPSACRQKLIMLLPVLTQAQSYDKRSKLVQFVGYYLSQNNFVRLLKTGKL